MGLLNRVWGSKQDRFARRVLAAIKEAGRVDAWYDADEFAIHYREPGDDSPSTAYLHNLFGEAADDSRPEQRERVERFVQSVVFAPRLPSEWELIAPLLRPVVRPGTFGLGVGRGLVLQSRSTGVPFLAEYVVIDQPASMAYVTTNHHELWGVSADEVFDTARHNLAATQSAAEPTNAVEPSNAAGVKPATASADAAGENVLLRLIEGGDSYWASRLLLAGGLADFTDRVGGRPVVFVPDTNGAVVTADRPEGIAALLAVIEKDYRQAVRPISPQAYTVDDDGTLIVYPAAPGTPAAAAVHKAGLLLAAAEYESQGAALSDSETAFAAKLILAEGNDRVFTVASWADGVDTLLPRAEYIAFSGESGEAFLVTWDSVLAEIPLVAVQGLRPERFRARTWPAAAVMDRLRATAVQL